jgi:hypothetical protein
MSFPSSSFRLALPTVLGYANAWSQGTSAHIIYHGGLQDRVFQFTFKE